MENPKRQWSVAEASPSGIAIVNDVIYMAALRGQRLWRIELNGDQRRHASGLLRRHLRPPADRHEGPGRERLWLSTTNADNNGGQADGSDRILRITII